MLQINVTKAMARWNKKFIGAPILMSGLIVAQAKAITFRNYIRKDYPDYVTK